MTRPILTPAERVQRNEVLKQQAKAEGVMVFACASCCDELRPRVPHARPTVSHGLHEDSDECLAPWGLTVEIVERNKTRKAKADGRAA